MPTFVQRSSSVELSVTTTASPKWLLALVSVVEPSPVCRMPAKIGAQTCPTRRVVAIKTTMEQPLRKQHDVARPAEERERVDHLISTWHANSSAREQLRTRAGTHLNESVAVSNRLPRLAAKLGASSQSICVARDGAALPRRASLARYSVSLTHGGSLLG